MLFAAQKYVNSRNLRQDKYIYKVTNYHMVELLLRISTNIVCNNYYNKVAFTT